MPTNKKKPISLRTRSTHFDPAVSKGTVTFTSPDSYLSRTMKIEGYETRLYWQFRYCDEHDGQTFFYTLTYNDSKMPTYKIGKTSFNCFDYNDLRDLLTGGFRKQLLRKFGTTFKYFIGAELGDGKGSRGMHNNPHYHVLFFLEPANNPRYPYIKINPVDFRHLVRMYWQGFDEDEGFQDYRTAKYGIAREGEIEDYIEKLYGRVINFRACTYCAKYVCKDAQLKMNERKVEKYLRHIHRLEKYPEECCRQFFYKVLMRMYNRSRSFTPQELLEHLYPGCFELWRTLDGELDVNSIDINTYECFAVDIPFICRNRKGLWKRYWKFKKAYDEERLRLAVNEYRNRYCNKCRISHGVGDYAIQFIDKLDPSIPIPAKDGFKKRPISMYYYRKLYLDVHIDVNGSPIYTLNQDGIAYKVNRLPSQVAKKAESARNLFSSVILEPDLFERMRDSDVNTKVFMHYPEFFKRYNYLLTDNNEQIFETYAYYKLVYENRFIAAPCDGSGAIANFCDIDPLVDYWRFLQPTFPRVYRDPDLVTNFFKSNSPGYLPYQSHPAFLRYIGLFDVLDMCADYFFVQKDNIAQKEAEERARIKRFHNVEKLKKFYEKFELTDIYN